MNTNLTPDEQKLFDMLKTLNDDSIIGLGVKELAKHDDEAEIRQSFRELRSQAYDNPPAMMCILGRDTYDQLLMVSDCVEA